jgi:predicted RNase H-like HicB family nuclease
MPEGKENQALVELTAVIWQENDDFVSLCPEVGVSSCGSTLEEARAMLEEAVDLYIENARELGILEDSLVPPRSSQRWTTSIRVAM